MTATGTRMTSDRSELALQVGQRSFLDRLGDLDHLRRALVGGEDAAHQVEAGQDGQYGGGGREQQPEPLGPAELELLVAAFRGQDVQHLRVVSQGGAVAQVSEG